MKKKIFLLISVISVMFSFVTVHAAVDAVRENDSVVFEKEPWMGNIAVVSFYDQSGVLSGSVFCREDNGKFVLPVDDEKADMRLRAYFGGETEIEDIKISVPTAAPVSEVNSTPVVEASPAAAPIIEASPVPTQVPEKSFPEIYEIEANARKAFSVVTGVRTVVDDAQGDGTYLTILYQGSEREVFVSDDVLIEEASAEFSYVKGMDASALQKGDVVNFSVNLVNRILKISLIYRPVKDDIVTSGINYGPNFERFLSAGGTVTGDTSSVVSVYGKRNTAKSQYVFGLIQDKSGNNVRLFNTGGKDADALEFVIMPGSVVYVCDMSEKMAPEVGTSASVVKSGIPKAAYDDEGNINYSDEYINNYMLARVVNDTVVDAVVYTNYNDSY